MDAPLQRGRQAASPSRRRSRRLLYNPDAAHLVDDKIHARSHRPYSLVTQQPWAERRSSAASASASWRCGRSRRTARPTRCRRCSRSSPTTHVGRVKAYEAIVKGDERGGEIAETTHPRVLQGAPQRRPPAVVALRVNVVSEEGKPREMRAEDDRPSARGRGAGHRTLQGSEPGGRRGRRGRQGEARTTPTWARRDESRSRGPSPPPADRGELSTPTPTCDIADLTVSDDESSGPGTRESTSC